MESQYVRQEVQHALRLNRPHFIRPTYWEEPLPEDPRRGLPPDELRALHFHRLSLPPGLRARRHRSLLWLPFVLLGVLLVALLGVWLLRR